MKGDKKCDKNAYDHKILLKWAVQGVSLKFGYNWVNII